MKDKNIKDNEIINKLLEAEKEIERTTIRYSVEEVLKSMNNNIKKY